LLQEGKRARSYRVMEPYLAKIERKYKHKRQRDHFFNKLGQILGKVERPYVDVKATWKDLSVLSRTRVIFSDDFKLSGTFGDFQLKKFDYNLLKYFFFVNSGYVNRVDGVYALKNYARFIKNRTRSYNNRVYTPVGLNMIFLFLEWNEKPKVEFPLKFFGYSFYKREKMYGLDNYFFANSFIKTDYIEENFFRF
jgi:hypothetical protein